MNILIVGCGHVGATLAHDLEQAGHDISILDKHAESFRQLSSFDQYTFGGTATTGDATDPSVLARAGIANCDAVAVVGRDDAENLMCAQIAQKVFDKTNVVCRVSQTELAMIYEKNYGLKTICPTILTAQAVFDDLNMASAITETEG